jgi:hypothetical protein
MTSLEGFLNKTKNEPVTPMEPCSGSFSCQDHDCIEVVFDGYVDRDKNRIHWTCSYGHESSVVI